MNIYTICLLAKLVHQHLRLYTVEKKVGSISYRLKLPLSIKKVISSILCNKTLVHTLLSEI